VSDTCFYSNYSAQIALIDIFLLLIFFDEQYLNKSEYLPNKHIHSLMI
jgi:hypothetical protein